MKLSLLQSLDPILTQTVRGFTNNYKTLDVFIMDCEDLYHHGCHCGPNSDHLSKMVRFWSLVRILNSWYLCLALGANFYGLCLTGAEILPFKFFFEGFAPILKKKFSFNPLKSTSEIWSEWKLNFCLQNWCDSPNKFQMWISGLL